jgi:predicted Rossmann fold nucleotide-binding protein DprA/Smf involved in DNA uptake
MRIAVIGSRSFNNYEYMQAILDSFTITLSDSRKLWFVSGGARGADKLAERYIEERKFGMTVYPADWKAHGKSAGFKRNKQIVDNADVVLAFWDGESKGTLHSINLAKEQGKPVYIFTSWKEQWNVTKT